MSTFTWIVGSTFVMSLLAWVGLIVVAFKEETLKKLLLPLVAFSAGALMGGGCLHLIPEAIARIGPRMGGFVWVLLGFSLFFLMEQFLAWHHHHAVPSEHKEPFTYLILVADGLHNFIGGLAIAGSFLAGSKVGIITWIAAAALGMMVVIIFINVIGRYLFRMPLKGTVEIVELALVVTVFFSMAYTEVVHGHITMDEVVARFPRRVRAIVLSVMYFAAAAFFFCRGITLAAGRHTATSSFRIF